MARTTPASRDAAPRGAQESAGAAAASGLLAEIFVALSKHGVRYCLLRGSRGGAADSGHREIDLLVDARDVVGFECTASAAGFVRDPMPGHGGHRFLVAYVESAREWLKLDVVTRLRYGGRSGALSTEALDGTLDRRRESGGTFVPDAADALVGLLLHGILDKRRFRDDHRQELKRLRALVAADPQATQRIERSFQEAFSRCIAWSSTSAAIANERWEWLISRRRDIAWALFRRDPLRASWRRIESVILRLTRPLYGALGRRGLSVALVGPDGAGKTTIARALTRDPEVRARIVYMGSNTRASTVGLPTSRWINRLRGRSPLLDGIAFGHRLVEQGYRSLVAAAWRLEGRIVVFDRHPLELAVAHPSPGFGPKLGRWLMRRAAARPDLVLILEVPPEILVARKSEHSAERAGRQMERYRTLARLIPGAQVMDASGSETDAVGRVTAAIWYGRRMRVAGAMQETPVVRAV